MNIEKNVEVLNDVAAKLTDSCKGYQMCSEVAEDNLILKNEFNKRKAERKQLVNEFQSKVSALGGDIEDDGTALGAVHRGYTKFVSVFKDDTKAAIDALDEGEEHLAKYIQDQLKEDALETDTSMLLTKAHASAVEGERLADLLDS